MLIYVSFSLLKVIHEIGHGLACKHYGGECNEMGLMLLVFTPCLYCDVTDSWMVESKWRRAMIGLAGVWFELITAAICMWIWWFSNPGIINSLCFHTMLVGSVFTLFFNGNPLLKYDAYFVISDLLDRPNLYQQARKVMSSGFAGFFRKNALPVMPDPSGRSNGLLWIYGSLAGIYRRILFVAIMWIVYNLFHSLRLEWLGLAFILFTVAVWLFGRFRTVMTVMKSPNRLGNLRAGRVSLSVLLAIVLAGVVIWLPLPARVRSPVLLEVKDAKSVVVMVDGRLESAAAEGTSVAVGDEVGRLESRELELNLAARRGELSRQRARLSGLESRRADDASVAARIPTVREAIAGLELEVQRLEADFAQLTLRAPIAGIVLAPPTIDPMQNPSDIQVWSGTPLDQENLGSLLQRGTTFCIVGDVNKLQGTVFLSQGQVELVRAGQQVTIKSQVNPHTLFQGKIIEVGTASVREIPAELAKSQVIPTRVNPQGRAESAEPVFAARIEVENESIHRSAVPPLHQSLGTVTVHVDPQSLGTRIARFVYSTFAIDPTVQQRTSR